MDIVSRKKHVSWLGKTSGIGLAQDSEPSPQHMKSPTETWVCVCVCGQRWDEVCTRRKVTRVGINIVNFPLSCSLWLCNSFWVRTERWKVGFTLRHVASS